MNQFISEEDMNQEYIDQYNNTFVNNSEYFKYSGIYINHFILKDILNYLSYYYYYKIYM